MKKKIFCSFLITALLVCFMPAMAFAADEEGAAAEKTWEANGKIQLELKSGEDSNGTVATITAYDDYSIEAKVVGTKVNAGGVSATLKMKNVQGLGVTDGREHTVNFNTGISDENGTDLMNWLKHVYDFAGCTLTGKVNGNAFKYNVTAAEANKTEGATTYTWTATPDSVDAIRAAWQELTKYVKTNVVTPGNSKIEIAQGAYLVIGSEKLTFDTSCTVDPSSDSDLNKTIRDAASLGSGSASQNIELYVPAQSSLQVDTSNAAVLKGITVRSNAAFTETAPLKKLQESQSLVAVITYLVELFNDAVGKANNGTLTCDILTDCTVTFEGAKDGETTTRTVVYGDKLGALPEAAAAPEGKVFDKWVVKDTTTAVTADTAVEGKMTIAAVYKDKTTTGGGSYVPGGGVSDPLPPAKTEANKNLAAEAAKEKYEDAEAAEIMALLEEAAQAIKNAKTVEEVKAIEAETLKKIEAVNTAAEKEEIRAVQGTKFVARSSNAKAPSGKKAIKVIWFKTDGSELNFDGYEIYRSTKKNSGYGTKPIYTAKKLQYFNTSAKKGVKYYYKVRGFKMINGQKVYTEYSLKAIRTAK